MAAPCAARSALTIAGRGTYRITLPHMLNRYRRITKRQDRRREDLVPGDQEDEDRGRREPRQGERERDAPERGRPAAAERHRGLLELDRDSREDTRRHE